MSNTIYHRVVSSDKSSTLLRLNAFRLMRKRGLLRTAVAVLLACCVISTARPESSAQTVQPDPSVFYQTKVLTRLCDRQAAVDVTADKFVFCLAGGGKTPNVVPDITKVFFDRLANQVVEINRLRGVSVEDIKKISFTQSPASGRQTLNTLNGDLLNQIGRAGCILIYVCVEDERCQCSWCDWVCVDGIVIMR